MDASFIMVGWIAEIATMPLGLLVLAVNDISRLFPLSIVLRLAVPGAMTG